MGDERKSRETLHSKAGGEDDAHIFAKTGSPDEEVPISSKINCDDTQNIEHLLVQTIKRTSNQISNKETEIPCDIIKLLGEFLSIQDYVVNAFSSWTLNTLMQQILQFSKVIDECDYKSFIYWLFEEIIMASNNLDMSREEFFKLMGGAFRQALSEILDGKDLLPLSKFVNLQASDDENIESSSIILREVDSNESLMSKESQKTKTTVTKSENKALQDESKISYYETVLGFIIESSYQIFGREVDYKLVQDTYRNQENVLYYKFPYHYRKPRVVKKLDSLRKVSAASHTKPEKASKKRKSSKKSYTKETIENQNNLILPLTEAMESWNYITQFYETKDTKPLAKQSEEVT